MPGFILRCAAVLLLSASLHAGAADLFDTATARSAQLGAMGDQLFRAARFEDADAAWSQAVDLDPSNVQAHLGIGKLALMRFDRKRAAAQYSAAYQLAPRNPDAILAFADVVENQQAKQTLLRNYLSVSRNANAEDVAARLRIAERLGSAPVSQLSSPYKPYRISLLRTRTGILLNARIDGSREFRLIVDTGATGIILNASAGEALKLDYLTDVALFGFGSSTPRGAYVGRAHSFETGELKIAFPLVNVSETCLTREADGMIGLDVFKDFLIRLDARGHTLELIPFEGQEQSQTTMNRTCGDCVRTYRLGNILLAQGTINGKASGYFVIDSGSPYTMVSRKLLHQEGVHANFEGAQGGQEVAVSAGPLNFRLGNQHLMDFEYATFDASEISSRNGIEIAGAIGYSLLRNLVLTVDYRDGVIRFGSSK